MAATPAPEEIELKLVARDPSALAETPRILVGLGLDVGPGSVQDIRDAYYDTQDWRNWRAGFALRLREKLRADGSAGRRILTRKALAAAEEGVAVRQEIEHELGPDEDPPLADMHPLFEVHQRRQVFPLTGPEGFTAELSCDRVTWKTGQGDTTAYEIEVELRTGPRTILGEIRDAILAGSHCRAESTSKFERGLQIAGLDPNGGR